MRSDFSEDILELDGYKFSLVWASIMKIDETTDWILMVDKGTKDFYEGHLEHDTRFLKMYKRLNGQ